MRYYITREQHLVIATNPRSYEANSNEFPDLFPAFKEPDNQFATSSYHALKSIKFPKKNPTYGFLDIGKQAAFECTSCTHSEE